MLITYINQNEKTFSFSDFLSFFNRRSELDNNQEIIRKLTYPPKNRCILHQLAEDDKQCLLMQVVTQNPDIDINQIDDENSTALIIALKNKHLSFSRYLIRNH